MGAQRAGPPASKRAAAARPIHTAKGCDFNGVSFGGGCGRAEDRGLTLPAAAARRNHFLNVTAPLWRRCVVGGDEYVHLLADVDGPVLHVQVVDDLEVARV